ncbi:hypothetical protein GGTG_11853 [Gaeumannomyces tritici R3-111a-1]|uniref:Uncharacterized protein n=1 Tax=Gaeumannomyces tritici (strain R3-111a-1) TaxID=644352 RepID=J3PEC8_GAET3|nr:hypothetical protein GGTG_11853 [Gaeumannomyces tritici R3-111a-1]EJT70830.1 hypothetical protein GGTG_11853 [Gaeumannomyces tritici R3-111a-1]
MSGAYTSQDYTYGLRRENDVSIASHMAPGSIPPFNQDCHAECHAFQPTTGTRGSWSTRNHRHVAEHAGRAGGGLLLRVLWMLAQVSVNISANAVSFANDVTTLLPRWLNIRRGTLLVSIVGGWALCRWIIVASGRSFLLFMQVNPFSERNKDRGWQVPKMGKQANTNLVKHRRYDVPALYDPRGIYRYGRYGTNRHVALATFPVVIPLMPGLANKVRPDAVPIAQGLPNLFSFN